MRKSAIAALMFCGVAVAGCQTDNTVTTAQYTANLTFDAAVKAFNGYRQLCADKTIPATCRAYVAKGQDVIRQAYAAEQIGNSAAMTDGLQALVAVVTALQSLKN